MGHGDYGSTPALMWGFNFGVCDPCFSFLALPPVLTTCTTCPNQACTTVMLICLLGASVAFKYGVFGVGGGGAWSGSWTRAVSGLGGAWPASTGGWVWCGGISQGHPSLVGQGEGIQVRGPLCLLYCCLVWKGAWWLMLDVDVGGALCAVCAMCVHCAKNKLFWSLVLPWSSSIADFWSKEGR